MSNQDNIQVKSSPKRNQDHHYPHLTGYEIRYFYEVFPSLNEVDLCVMMGLTAFAFGGVETTPTRGALATFVQGKTLESRKLKITRSLKRMETAGALEIFEQAGSASIYDITLFNVRTDDYARAQGWFDSIKFNPTLITNDNTPLSDLITLKNKQEDVTDKNKTLPAPLSSESVTDDLDNSPVNQSSDNVQFMINTTEQLAQLDLTTPQRTVLIGWLVSHAHTDADFAPYTGKRTQVMNNLVKQGYLTTNPNGDFSTRLQSTKPKSILFSLTYADLDTAPPEGKKPTDKPFWEGVAAMYCWNDNGLDDWRKYAEIATPNQIATLNNKIKLTCLALDALHLDDPFTVEEFRWIINHWLHTKFKTVPIAERRFAVSGEAIANNWNAMRVSYKLYKKLNIPQTEL